MKAVVLAAGFATRMYPLTRDRAKPLLEVGGRPVIAWILDRVLALDDVDEVLVVTNARFHGQFAAWLATYEADVTVRLLDDGATSDEAKRGAIGDLALAVGALDDPGADLLVVAGDNLLDFDLAPYAERFAAEGRTLLLVREIEGQVPPRRYNEVVLDSAGEVALFREKPADPRSNLSALCLYFLPGSVRGQLEEYMRTQAQHDAPGYFIEWLAERVPLAAARIEGTWHDIGNLESLERARAAFAAREGR